MTLISINFVKILKMAFFEKNKNKSQSYKLGEEIDTGKIITIKDAQNGLKCNCICSDCKALFEAIQGTKNEWHFRHHNKDTNCKGGQETALHLLAKEIICRNTEMIVPNNAKIKYTRFVSKCLNQHGSSYDSSSKKCIFCSVFHTTFNRLKICPVHHLSLIFLKTLC